MDRFGDLLPRPHTLHHRDPFWDPAHGLRGGIGTHGLVVLPTATDTQPDGQAPAAEHVSGRERLRQYLNKGISAGGLLIGPRH